jgi:hypothetical protein
MGCNGNLAWRAAQEHECKCHCEENMRSHGWDACCRLQARSVLNARMAAWYSLWLAVSGFSLPCGYGMYGIETVATLLALGAAGVHQIEDRFEPSDDVAGLQELLLLFDADR